jgi:hypothetical protein
MLIKKHNNDSWEDSYEWKQKTLAAPRRHKVETKILFILMCIAAVLTTMACIYAYCFDKVPAPSKCSF